MLAKLLVDFSHTYIVISTVDVLIINGQVCQILLANMRLLQRAQNIQLMITLRFIPPELHDPQGFPCMEICANNDDVERYFYGHMSDLSMSVLDDPKLQASIVKSIADAVHGIFSLVQLHVESLTDTATSKAINHTLESLSKDSEALDIAYS